MLPSIPRTRALALAGSLTLAAVPAVATAQTASPQATASASPVTAKLSDSHVRYGADAVVTGRVAQAGAGTSITLEFRPGGGQWAPIGRATTDKNGRFKVRGDVRRGGRLRVVLASGGTTAVAAGTATAAPQSSRELSLKVAAALRTSKVRRDVVAGRAATVSGRVLPAGSGRVVRLQIRRGGAWKTVDRDATSRSGVYRLRYTPRAAGRMTMRIRVAPARGTTAARRTLGALNVYRHAFASWYGPGFYGRRTACGQTLGYGTLGVAHKSLPCGTKITFKLRGRKVTVPVIDRGPYVHGREYDLTGATKRALGFGSTGMVLSTI